MISPCVLNYCSSNLFDVIFPGIRFRQKEKHDGNSANNEKEESEALLDKGMQFKIS